MRLFSLRIVALTLLFGALIVGVRLIGRLQQPTALTMLQSANCSQPCWHGIQPGQTTVEQTIGIIEQEHVFDPQSWLNLAQERCWKTRQPPIWDFCAFAKIDQPSESIQKLVLTPPTTSLSLGDVIGLLGTPIGLRVSQDGGGYQGDGSFVYTVLFTNNVTATVHTRKLNISPQMTTNSLTMLATQVDLPIQAWRGFGRKVRLTNYYDDRYYQP